MGRADADSMGTDTPLVSVVVPCYNEAGTICETVEALHTALKGARKRHEIIVVDDGSRDDSLEKLHGLDSELECLKIIELLRNFGQSAAYQAGLNVAAGEYILLFSGDLETPVDELLGVIEALDDGYDFVNTSRKDRWGGSHALKSKLANRLLNLITGTRFSDRGSGLKGMRREIAESLNLYGEWHRFIPDLASIYTERMTEIEVSFEERKAGISSYKGRLKSITVFLDLATVAFTVHCNRKPFLLQPGRMFGFTGLLLGAAGTIITAWLIFQKVFFAQSLSNRPLFIIGLFLAVSGIVMVLFGLLGELSLSLLHKQAAPHSKIRRR